MFKRYRSGQSGFTLAELVFVIFFIGCVAAWFTHVITCLLAAKWGFLIAGAIMFPVAIVHGVMIWFGFGV